MNFGPFSIKACRHVIASRYCLLVLLLLLPSLDDGVAVYIVMASPNRCRNCNLCCVGDLCTVCQSKRYCSCCLRYLTDHSFQNSDVDVCAVSLKSIYFFDFFCKLYIFIFILLFYFISSIYFASFLSLFFAIFIHFVVLALIAFFRIAGVP